MYRKNRLLLLSFFMLTITGCSGNPTSGGEPDYEQTKKMVVDILKTDDGKKAIQEVMSDDGMKQKLVMDQKIVMDTIEKTLTSDKGADFWKKSFEDPKFAESVAKSMKKENEKLLKDLMKDPEYRGMMIEILKDPELEKELINVLKSKEYKEHLQSAISETFDSPLFKVKIQSILIKAAEEIKTTGKSEGDKSGGGDGGDSGGSSG
ncbi:MAG TPA: spore germination lipoprotein GerD [Pseudoneobacillus sp.]|nr:spore germination lipoprotein GerD [Pseudoneobacillus sp.]